VQRGVGVCCPRTAEGSHDELASTNGPNKKRRKAIPATCAIHRGPIGFANLLVSMQDGSIVFDPHVTGACVIAINEEGATILCDVLTEWLG
jgi:hypothetical protein